MSERREERMRREFAGLGVAFLGLVLLLSMLPGQAGLATGFVNRALRLGLGLVGAAVPFVLLLLGTLHALGARFTEDWRFWAGSALTTVSLCVLLHLHLGEDALHPQVLARYGGYLGAALSRWLRAGIGMAGSYPVALAVLAGGVSLLARGRFPPLRLSRREAPVAARRRRAPSPKPEIKEAPPKGRRRRAPGEARAKEVEREAEPKASLIPPLSLLEPGPDEAVEATDRELEEKKALIEQTLRSFGIEAEVTGFERGPTVTRYEVRPAPGVRVSKIARLADDLALALAALSVRIEAPVPGKSVIGIEVPNRKISLVRLRGMLESDSFRKHPSKLALALGRDIAGEPVVADLTQMPHLLIGGATNSGKTVCLNAIIMSILFRATPEEAKFIIVDPKRVELVHYTDLPHLVMPVVTDVQMAAGALRWAIGEMERRYERLSEVRARTIASYNQKVGPKERLPYIVIIIDELADLMKQAPGEFEMSICRLAQLARAVGIHLVIATQRPSVDVITGTIKANIPSRIAFSVSSHVDSRVILDMTGAERLVGKGDMLFLPVDSLKPRRVQGTFVSEEEVERVVSWWREHSEARFEVQPADLVEEATAERTRPVEDPLFKEAVKLVVTSGHGSVSMLQRKLNIGYNRAARMMEAMEELGIVGPPDSAKAGHPRPVLISPEKLEEILGQL